MSDSQIACETIPPVEANYTPKGSWVDLGGLKTYSVGPDEAKAAVFFIYDVYGYAPQTIQGADILASQGFKVYMPDLFLGSGIKPEWAGTEEGAQKRKEFSAGPGNAAAQSEVIAKLIGDIKAKGYSKVGFVGLCWGYNASVSSVGLNTADALATCHPSAGAVEQGEKINIPVCLLPSQNEDAAVYKAIFDAVEKKLPGKSILDPYLDMHHGWAGARADLEDETGRKRFADAYSTIATFFKTTLA